MQSKTISLWDKIVENAPEDFKDYFEKEEKFIKEYVSKKDIVLDLGCGTGRTINIMSPFCKEIIGIDNDEFAVEKGNKNIDKLKNAKIIFADAEKTPFPNNKFDVIFSGLTFVNFGKTKFGILQEIKRTLKKNGKFIFSVYNENSLNERLEMYKKYEPRKIVIDEKGNVSFGSEAVSEKFSREEIIKILEDSKFKVGRIAKGRIFYLIEAYCQ